MIADEGQKLRSLSLLQRGDCGRDAADVAISAAFGSNTLKDFRVLTGEIGQSDFD